MPPEAGHTGTAHLDATAIAAHVTACTEAGIQAGFHAIGDAALTAVVEGVRAAADKLGTARVRAARHRVEHAEMLTPRAHCRLRRTGPDRLRAARLRRRLGRRRRDVRRAPGRRAGPHPQPVRGPAARRSPARAGLRQPRHPLDPWGTVRAAAFHRTPEHRVSVRAAFTAHTRGGWRAIGRDDAGVLVPGAPADYAVWETGDLVVQVPDHRVADWSTDPRSGTPGLPDLTPGALLPVCLRTVVGGREVYASPARPNE
ncbi:hypothetical protein GCM10020000_68270 [Streptomyces olivoverticillatus]